MKKMRTLFVVAVVMLLLASVALVTPARSAPATQVQAQGGGPVSSGQAVVQKLSDVAAYWTPERMAAAQPMPLREAEAKGTGVSPSAVAAFMATQQPGFAPGNAPGKSPAAVPGLADFTQPVAAISNYYTYPFPYTYSYIGGGLQLIYPEITNGKLFFTQNGGNYVCSGTSVTDNGAGVNRLVATAGHCVHDGSNSVGGWSYNVYFCPAYWTGATPYSPYGCWGESDEWTTSGWYTSGDLRYDHGFIVTTTTSTKGYGRIATVVGTNGEAWGQGSQQEIWSFGYPAAAPFDGTILVWTTSGVAQIDDCGGAGSPYCWGVGSNETGGSSGGAWVILQRWASPGYVVGHNDFKYTSPSMPLAMFSPYQDNSVWLTLYNFARVENP